MAGLNTSYLVMPFPPGSNDTDTLISGTHFNKTTLEYWNYTLYANNTISNGSWCLLAFDPYTPDYIFPNGSWTNETWCYRAINPIGARAGIGIGFVVAFGACLIASTVNLTVHGKQYLPSSKRFLPVGRRWQWYWGLFACATALVSLITNIDVDRYYVTELPIILNVFFWFLMQVATIAAVWEAVRHWGSWMERQMADHDPFYLKDDDRRSKVEFWLPLVFYLWFWLHLLLIIPRNWEPLEKQRYPGQAEIVAAATATDNRFKASAFLLIAAWATIAFSLLHSIKHYVLRNPYRTDQKPLMLPHIPPRLGLIMFLSFAIIIYQILVAFKFDYSPLKVKTDLVAMYVGGYTPALLVQVVQNAFGFCSPNEDREIMRQRHRRGLELDREEGNIRRPFWWNLIRYGNTASLSMTERLTRNVGEIDGRKRSQERGVNLTTERVHGGPVQAEPRLDISINSTTPGQGSRSAAEPPPPPYREREGAAESLDPSSSGQGDGLGVTQPKPERPRRTMLDV